MIEHEKAVWRQDEASDGTEEAATRAQQSPAPVVQMNEDARRARFREALDHVMSKHHDVLAALAK